MKTNIGKSDRTGRIILGTIIGAASIYFKSWGGLLAVVPLVTAFAGYCPVYTLLGVDTCEKNGTSCDEEMNE